MDRVSKRAYILFETLMALMVLVLLVPTFFGWVLLEVRDNQKKSVDLEVNRQLDFTQRYLQSLCDLAVSVTVTQSGLNIATSTDVVEVACRKDAIYVRKEAYRYLTTDPVLISGFKTQVRNPSLCEIQVSANNKSYSFLLIL